MNKDLFGQEIIEDVLLRDKFIEPPFSVLDTKSKNWQNSIVKNAEILKTRKNCGKKTDKDVKL